MKEICLLLPDSIISTYIKKLLKSEDKYVTLRIRRFYDLFYHLEDAAKKVAMYSHSYYKEKTGDVLEDEYLVALENFKEIDLDIDYVLDCVLNKDFSLCENLIEKFKNLISTSSLLYKVQDLFYVKEELYESLTYIIGNEAADVYRNNYTNLLMERPVNISKIENYLKKMQEIILDDWQSKITDVSKFMPGEDYKFIAHSMCSPSFRGNFLTPLVSCSLLTPEFNDTFRSKFGFILKPKNIIGASDVDLYINNNSVNNKDCVTGTSVPTILSIDHIIEKMRVRREYNKKNKIDEKIYSEVIERGFEPCAIFCYTEGAKKLNKDYCNALKLKECRPDLEIIDIDETLYKENQLTLRKELIDRIEEELGNNSVINHIMAQDYDMFWNDFLNLKNEPNYSEKDIIKLYLNNKRLLDENIRGENLLNGDYSLEDIRYIIYYNQNFRLKDIISGKASVNNLLTLYNNLLALNDNEYLEQIIPGLSLFVKLYGNIEISKIVIESINTCTSVMDINKLLMSMSTLKMKEYSLKELSVNVNSFFNTDINKYSLDSFYNRLNLLKRMGELKETTDSLELFLLIYPYVSFTTELENKISNLTRPNLYKVLVILIEALELQELKTIEQINSCENQMSMMLDELNYKRDLFEKDEFFHNILIVQNFYGTTSMDINDKKEYINDLKFQLSKLRKNDEEQKNILKNKLDQLYNEIDTIKNYFMAYTGYNYDTYSSSLLDAIEFTKTNYMSDVARDIDRLKNNIKQLELYLINLKEQKEQYNLMIAKSRI